MEDYKADMPVGLGFSMALNEKAMTNFGNMTEEQRQNVIAQSKHVQSKAEMQHLVDQIATNNLHG